MKNLFEELVFGERNGSHQLLSSTLHRDDPVTEELRFLVDRPAGHVGPEVVWSPYWGCGPVGDWWAIWRGEENANATRKNMVDSRVLLAPLKAVGELETIETLIGRLCSPDRFTSAESTEQLLRALSAGPRPIVVPGFGSIPALLRLVWPRLWPAARRAFSVRSVFADAGDLGTDLAVVAIPAELRALWRSRPVVEIDGPVAGPRPPTTAVERAVDETERLLRSNWEVLPADLSILPRVERLASVLREVRRATASTADALVAVRTLEAFGFDMRIDDDVRARLVRCIAGMHDATITDVRSAALVELRIAAPAEISDVVTGMAAWVAARLSDASLDQKDVLWVLRAQSGNEHATWWRRAVQLGVAAALAERRPDWCAALWRWWSAEPSVTQWVQTLLPQDSMMEEAVLDAPPKCAASPAIREFFARREWAKLTAFVLRFAGNLESAIDALRREVARPEEGLAVLLVDVPVHEMIDLAAKCGWEPLVAMAADKISKESVSVSAATIQLPYSLHLVSRCLADGGMLPGEPVRRAIVDKMIERSADGDRVAVELASRMEPILLVDALRVFERIEGVLANLPAHARERVAAACAREWILGVVGHASPSPPTPTVRAAIRRVAGDTLAGRPVRAVLECIESSDALEVEAREWLFAAGHSWTPAECERVAALLRNRRWADSVRSFARSWRRELRAVAWLARDLLHFTESWLLSPPSPTSGVAIHEPRFAEKRGVMKVLFFAANPMSTSRLALDEEVRAIEDRVKASRYREDVEFVYRWAARPGDLQQALLEEDPDVVHFSGHGAGRAGVVLHNEHDRSEHLVSSDALEHLFRSLRGRTRVVLLNACFSEEQARAIVASVDVVLGMSDTIADEAARLFAEHFYQALAYGKSVGTAFDLGVNALKMHAQFDADRTPVMIAAPGVDVANVTLIKP